MSARHPYLDFDKLKTITLITGRLVNETPLRIGAGTEPPLSATVDLAVIRIRRGDSEVPYIPGSSLKGVFRTFVERMVRSTGREVHSPWDVPEEESNKSDPKPCVVCGIFGNTTVASHVKVFDAFPVEEPRTLIKTSVGIDREFGGSRPGILYAEEFVSPETSWCFRMEVLNIEFPVGDSSEDERALLLNSLFRALKSVGLQVGARKSVGAGLIKLKEASWERYEPKDGSLVKLKEGKL